MEDLTKGRNDIRRRLLDPPLRLGKGHSLLLGTCLQRVRRGLGCHTQGVGSYEELADEAVAKARAAVAATTGAKLEPKLTERSAEEYGDRIEAQKVEICIESQIRAAGEDEEARARSTATRRRRADTKRAERCEKAWIERERTEAKRRGSYR